MKKIINKPETLVREMCNGLVLAHPELDFDPKFKVISKKEINQSKVTLISGGGSGHEPAHAGFVGTGMLDAAVCGDVFASPSQIQVYQAIRRTASTKGSLLIIKNYSGDIMNFKNAAHLATEDGIEVDYVKVDDDIAVEDSLYTVGRRGVAGTVLVHKVAGAAAEAGLSLAEVKEAAQHAIDHVRSIGFAYTSCTVPAKGTPTFHIEENEMEYGVGIHGEPGIRREKIVPADELAQRMVTSLLDNFQMNDQKQEEVAVLINGFGGTPLQELYLLNNSVIRELTAKNKQVFKVFVGNYMTSIDMAGASVTIMKLDETLKKWLSAPCDTPALSIKGPFEPVKYTEVIQEEKADSNVSFKNNTDAAAAVIKNNQFTLQNIVYLLDQMSQVIIENEVPFCELDSHAGDGDFGMSVAKGFKQLKVEWEDILAHHLTNIGEFLDACSMVIMEYCGGASGPIWGSGFRAASKNVQQKEELTIQEFADMMQSVVKGIQDTGERSFGRGAVVGDKTLIDALVPFADAWTQSAEQGDDIKVAANKAAEAAVQGSKNTIEIVARMGRAGTVGERSIGYPDAGAHALGVIFTELAKAMK
ncbi:MULTISPECIES: dihydroxyacetone kinase subunit DhaK [unclassified Paenibacillus]|uniref:dihydroxyacetone kinase subunit DhaK n=1 Tax=unclassified Paenibacillus TaxID=185978 RepID=UPI002474881F|nr:MULTISPECIES: dihydroxyacetone kinase subunit DhaK [unclassified Paenibacillus]MDH6427442.1 dihydroxyacetone kinase DhaK subunit/dihydroxyacetone kinase phosphoprotein-dependent L subunit [Paenibacillus sp. PastH-4]MDH6443472.1 dihydroxyacetone kinase DhaK subunit/dihydroxyacetone kinase phosphoprotein-dependent L subunit [Paenibacillus sp. PastF-4]MDH6525824.1 dihydroxyacetone kinase DhaK subunit/dihydroxyacetone kinase phosphoprotein-dependent L subunit [Paenibacillus sp. PastH-3]